MSSPANAPSPAAPNADDASGTAAAQPGRSPKAALLITTLLLGVLSFQLNASMVTPALPQIGAHFSADAGAVAQVQSMFFLAGAISGPIMGRWSDFIGRRRALLLVLGVMAVGTILCLLAPSMPVLIVGRFLQGVSSAIFALAYIVLRENLDARAFGTSVGIIAAVNGGVAGFDGYAGGLMTEAFGFQSIFLVVLALAAIAAVCIVRIVPGGSAVSDSAAMDSAMPDGGTAVSGGTAASGRMDWWGAGFLSVFLVCLSYFVSTGSSAGWTSVPALALLAGTIASFAAFCAAEKRRSSPLIAVHHLRSRQVWTVIATTVLTLAGIFAIMNFTVVLLSQDGKNGFGLSASLSALLFLTPAALIGVFAAPLAGWLTGRVGWIRTLRIGTALSLVCAVAAALFVDNQWLVLAAVAALGIFYNGFFLTSINGLSVLLSPKDAPGSLPGINGASFGTGASLGVVLVAPFAGLGTQGGYAVALWISVGITAAALLLSLLVPAPETD
ncbi:MFS transporter [Arthrobacter sp. SW1]|uniref:MFS transporter n=1 Tax=Arthrobacter sp. SW1 TaxID=1920889 RepID=UPI000877B96A|nr:MFS transporter [Arthrobacter sp. SW1]OFI38790.1 MFS transporter [Arthrobacter sp. SW1]